VNAESVSLSGTAIGDSDGARSAAATVERLGLHLPHDFLASLVGNFTKDDMLVVKVRSFDESYEELGSIGVLSGVCHGEKIRLIMLLVEVFVLELIIINRLPASSIATGEVTTLSHKPANDPMELGTLVAGSHLASAKSSEVLCRSRDNIIVENEVNTTPLLSSAGGGSVGNIEPSHFSFWWRSTKEASAVTSVDEGRRFLGGGSVEK